jgi:neurexin
VLSLVARDSGGQSVTDNIQVIIDTASTEDVSFIIKAKLDVNYTTFSARTVNLVTLMHRISTFYGDSSPEFYTITSLSIGSVLLDWTDNRISKVACQTDNIVSIFSAVYSGGRINPAFNQTLSPEFPVTSLSYELLGVCAVFPESTTVLPLPNKPPELVNPMRKVVVRLGTYFSVVIPQDTFYDYEDGNTRSLSLRLTTSSGTLVDLASFIQFNGQTQTLYGLPLQKHVQVEPLVLSLVAQDSGGETVTDNMEIIIDTASIEDVSFVIKAVFDLNYTTFSARTVNLITLINKIATFYGDISPEFYTVTALSSGSVLLDWTDNRISKVVCQNDSIQELYNAIYSGGRINPAFSEILLPEFVLRELSYDLLGVCLLPVDTVTESLVTTAVPVAAAGTNIVLVTILPILLLLIIIAIIILIYCCCFRNRHKHTDYLTDDEKLIYTKNRKPVVLESELEMNDVPRKPRRPMVMEGDIPPKVFDNPGYLELDDERRAPPPYSLPVDDMISPVYRSAPSTSTPKLFFPDQVDTDHYDDRPLPPAYRVPPLYVTTPGSSEI